MCGIFGFVITKEIGIQQKELSNLLHNLFLLSESRGKEAAGIAFVSKDAITLMKSPTQASHFIKTPEYQNSVSAYFSDMTNSDAYVCIGHSRMVTNGGQQINSNNQPVVSDGMAAIHNGIITNVDDLWLANPGFSKKTQVDTEVFLSLLNHSLELGKSVADSIKDVYQKIEGVASIALLFSKFDSLVLASNNGSLYFVESREPGILVFASEKHILEKIITSHRWLAETEKITRLIPGNLILAKYDGKATSHFKFSDDHSNIDPDWIDKKISPRHINDISPKINGGSGSYRMPGEGPYFLPLGFQDAYPEASEAVANLRRCTKCILPETMPFIEFDEDGVCNYCRYEEPYKPEGRKSLEEIIAPYRKNDGEPECLVTFSGGRDSSYGVHYIAEELKLKPVTYTYDWGMVTDLGRRNQMRMCGKLGLEHILVSADIARKRKNIRMNVSAWLKNPDLGTIPLFMAGDKQYFYYANEVSKQTGCKLIILCENLLETTRFKSGYCGISPHFGSSHTYSLKLGDKFRLLKYYGSQFLNNSGYLNSSLIDTFGAYLSYYFIPHNYINLYQYIQWDESEINKTLIETYNWETAKDTRSTWRIGDGTASFYNYIYYLMAGFTENDTFRSNQIRAGIINREFALTQVNEENMPRYDSIQWYCDIIGLDFESAIKSINNAPRRYKLG